jgi:hypothetical protein
MPKERTHGDAQQPDAPNGPHEPSAAISAHPKQPEHAEQQREAGNGTE